MLNIIFRVEWLSNRQFLVSEISKMVVDEIDVVKSWTVDLNTVLKLMNVM